METTANDSPRNAKKIWCGPNFNEEFIETIMDSGPSNKTLPEVKHYVLPIKMDRHTMGIYARHVPVSKDQAINLLNLLVLYPKYGKRILEGYSIKQRVPHNMEVKIDEEVKCVVFHPNKYVGFQVKGNLQVVCDPDYRFREQSIFIWLDQKKMPE